jgi:hypothetical protein
LRLVIGDLIGETTMSGEEKFRRSLFAHIEHKADEVWKSIDDLQKAMEAVPTAERSGPERRLRDGHQPIITCDPNARTEAWAASASGTNDGLSF